MTNSSRFLLGDDMDLEGTVSEIVSSTDQTLSVVSCWRVVLQSCFTYSNDDERFDEALELAMLIERACQTGWCPEDEVDYVPLNKMCIDTLVRSDNALDLVGSNVGNNGKSMPDIKISNAGSPVDHLKQKYQQTVGRDIDESEYGSIIDRYRNGIDWIKQQDVLVKSRTDSSHTGDIDFSYYNLSKDCYETVCVQEDSRVYSFAEMVRSISEESQFSDQGVVMWYFTDVRPILPRWIIHQGENDKLDNLSVEFVIDNITSHDFRLMSKRIRPTTGGGRQKKSSYINLKDAILMEIVRKRGGVPPRGKEKFWEEIFELCHDYGIESWSTSSTVKKRFSRLKEKFSS